MRLRTCFSILTMLVLPLGLAWGQSNAASSGPTAAGNEKKAPAPKASTAAAPKAPAKTAPARRTASVPLRQRNPAKDRYVEIQQALADAGFFSGPVNGVWNEASIRSLREFQEAEGLTPTGKIDAQSLIRLGLGPQYDSQGEVTSSGAGSPG